MKLYKFRSLNNPKFAFDILINSRLYCANYESLNDPFEGEFITIVRSSQMLRIGGSPGISGSGMLSIGGRGGMSMIGPSTRKKYTSIKDIIPDDLRICSLTKELTDVRMWAHYAAGHEGVAIEIELDETDEDLVEIEYFDGLQKFKKSALKNPNPKELLSSKTKHWLYEKEWRIIGKNKFFEISDKITGVYMGSRISSLNRTLIEKILPASIPLFETTLNRNNISVQPGMKIERG